MTRDLDRRRVEDARAEHFTHGWVIIGKLWHFFRNGKTCCEKAVTPSDIRATLALRESQQGEMTPGVGNCQTCQRERLAEMKGSANG